MKIFKVITYSLFAILLFSAVAFGDTAYNVTSDADCIYYTMENGDEVTDCGSWFKVIGRKPNLDPWFQAKQAYSRQELGRILRKHEIEVEERKIEVLRLLQEEFATEGGDTYINTHASGGTLQSGDQNLTNRLTNRNTSTNKNTTTSKSTSTSK